MSQNAGRSYFALVTDSQSPVLANGFIDLTPGYIVPKTSLKKAIFIAPVAPPTAAAGFLKTTFASTYVSGDFIRLTITSNLTNRQQWRKSYTYSVVSGDTVTIIAAAFASLISADMGMNSPYASATSALGVLTVTQKGDDKRGLVGYDYTDSASGTIVTAATQTVYSEGQPSDLMDKGVDALAITLGSYDTVRIAANPEAAVPFINAVGAVASEIYWYGKPGEGAPLAALINA
tara:strand:- start:1078 stop:1776 length:699 start_codon:yes stop_codon:yes gene_type:complete